jgi:hypothetical protein
MARFIFETPRLACSRRLKIAVNDRSSQRDCVISNERKTGVEIEEGGRETHCKEDEWVNNEISKLNRELWKGVAWIWFC